jgi:hypothetical protein
MSTALRVPETWGFAGAASRTPPSLVSDACTIGTSDGLSHARLRALVIALAVAQQTIALLGPASALGGNGLAEGMVRTLRALVPSPEGPVLSDARWYGPRSRALRTDRLHRVFSAPMNAVGSLRDEHPIEKVVLCCSFL